VSLTKFYILTETPSRVVIGDLTLDEKVPESRPFINIDGEFFLGEKQSFHRSLLMNLINDGVISGPKADNYLTKETVEPSGRIWPEQRVVSLWTNLHDMNEFNNMKKHLDKNGVHIDGDWHIDYRFKDEKEFRTERIKDMINRYDGKTAKNNQET